ncbi:MAG: hypothetical protein KGK07_09335 [Chloroflexota bacterium]|nr:hypothetical protein [Chloroflexota bacterium]
MHLRLRLRPRCARERSRPRQRPPARRAERGQVLLLGAAFLVILVGATGLAIDAGVARIQRRDVQNAADAAALAGADDLPDQSAAVAISDALCRAAQNGAVDQQGNVNCQNQSYGGDAGVTVTVNSPPVHSKSHNGDPNSVEVTITKKVRTSFMGVLGIRTVTVTAHAVATASGLRCALCVLSSTAPQALFGNNAATLRVNGLGIVVNSSAANAGLLKDSAQVTAPTIGVVGCTELHNTGTFTPTAQCGVPPVSDPLASLAVPSVSGPNDGSVSASKNQTINPGIYSSISVGGSGNLTLNPGTYVITGQFGVHDSGAVSGNGVTLYFACPSYPTPCTPGETDGGNLYINDAATFNITAPTTGPEQGIAIFYDRNNAAGLTSRDASNPSITGTIYARSSLALFGDKGTATLNSLVVVNMISVQDGTRGVTINYDKTQNATPSTAGASSLTE